jgi:hypothetical protein
MVRKKAESSTVEGSHTISPIDGSAKLHFASKSSSTVPDIRQGLLHPVAKLVLLILSVMSISVSLYTITEPLMDPQRAEIMNPPDIWRSLFLTASRVFALYIFFELGLDGTCTHPSALQD